MTTEDLSDALARIEVNAQILSLKCPEIYARMIDWGIAAILKDEQLSSTQLLYLLNNCAVRSKWRKIRQRLSNEAIKALDRKLSQLITLNNNGNIEG